MSYMMQRMSYMMQHRSYMTQHIHVATQVVHDTTHTWCNTGRTWPNTHMMQRMSYMILHMMQHMHRMVQRIPYIANIKYTCMISHMPPPTPPWTRNCFLRVGLCQPSRHAWTQSLSDTWFPRHIQCTVSETRPFQTWFSPLKLTKIYSPEHRNEEQVHGTSCLMGKALSSLLPGNRNSIAWLAGGGAKMEVRVLPGPFLCLLYTLATCVFSCIGSACYVLILICHLPHVMVCLPCFDCHILICHVPHVMVCLPCFDCRAQCFTCLAWHVKLFNSGRGGRTGKQICAMCHVKIMCLSRGAQTVKWCQGPWDLECDQGHVSLISMFVQFWLTL